METQLSSWHEYITRIRVIQLRYSVTYPTSLVSLESFFWKHYSKLFMLISLFNVGFFSPEFQHTQLRKPYRGFPQWETRQVMGKTNTGFTWKGYRAQVMGSFILHQNIPSTWMSGPEMSGRYGWCNLWSTFTEAAHPSFTWSPMQRQGEASKPVLEAAAPRTGGLTCQACSAASYGQDAPPALCAGDPPSQYLCTWYHPSPDPTHTSACPWTLAPPASGNPWFSVFSEGLPTLIHLLSNLDSFTITYTTILPYGQDSFYSAVL